MSAALDHIAAVAASWRGRAGAARQVLERRLWLDRWFPHILLALAVAPLGLLLIDLAARSVLGASVAEMNELERRLADVELGALHEFAVGALFVAMALGLGLRSRLAWWMTTLGLATALFVRVVLKGDTEWPVVVYVAIVLLALVSNRRRFGARSVAASSLFAAFAILTVFAYQTLATLQLGTHFDPPIVDLETAMYYVVVTISTVGYGDITPADSEARVLTVWLIVSGLAVSATALSAVIVPVVTNRLKSLLGTREDIVDRVRHFVIVGSSPLARNTAEELEKRGQRVTLVLEQAIDSAFYLDRDVVVGDATDLSVLRAAGADHARGVLALSTDDSENGFVVLGVNELSPTTPTVAALNDPKNHFRLKRAQPSMLLSLQVLGGQLLAKALTGERVEADMLEKVLQLHSTADDPGDEPAGRRA